MDYISDTVGYSDAGRWKTLEGPVVIDGDNLPSPVGIGLTDLPIIGGASGPPGPPGSGTTDSVWQKLGHTNGQWGHHLCKRNG